MDGLVAKQGERRVHVVRRQVCPKRAKQVSKVGIVLITLCPKGSPGTPALLSLSYQQR